MFNLFSNISITALSVLMTTRMETRQKELDLLYSPLYQIVTEMLIDENQTKENVLHNCLRVHEILQSNKDLVRWALLQRMQSLLKDLTNGDDYQHSFESVCYSIQKRYHYLRRLLGYPTLDAMHFILDGETRYKILFFSAWGAVIFPALTILSIFLFLASGYPVLLNIATIHLLLFFISDRVLRKYSRLMLQVTSQL